MCLKCVSHNLCGLDHAIAEHFRLPKWFTGHSHHVLWEAWVSGLLLHAYWKLQRCLCLWKEGGTSCLWSCNTLLSSQQALWTRVIQRGWDLRQERCLGCLSCRRSTQPPSPPVVVESGSLGHPPNSTAHRFCVRYKLQKLDPSCGLQITLSCILSRPWELEKTVHEGNTISSWGRKRKN